MVGIDHLDHPDKDLLTSDLWGSYFYYARNPTNSRVAAAVNFRNLSASVTGSSSTCGGGGARPSSSSLKRVSSMKSASDFTEVDKGGATSTTTMAVTQETIQSPPGPKRINTMWGTQVRDHARMCIPDLNVLIDYPIDFRFPAFGWTKRGELTSSGFFPADPVSLHHGESAASIGGRGRRFSGKRPIWIRKNLLLLIVLWYCVGKKKYTTNSQIMLCRSVSGHFDGRRVLWCFGSVGTMVVVVELFALTLEKKRRNIYNIGICRFFLILQSMYYN